VKRLVRRAIVSPVLSEEQVDAMDPSDREMVASICQRRADQDAAGRVIGVVPLDVFEPFPAKHGCGEDCRSCEEARLALSAFGGR
jgi:hypothetical protein